MSAGHPYRSSAAIVQLGVILTTVLAAACGSTSVTDVSGPGPVRCNATLSVQPPTLPADGGPAAISISAARDCTWSARSEASWLQLTSTSGQGESTVTVNASSNPQAGSRTGGILVNDQRLSVTQDGRGCHITLGTPTTPVASAGDRRALTINTLAGCPWTIESSATWLVPLTASGSGQGSVLYDVRANTGSAREGSLTVASQQVIVSQLAAPVAPPCTYTIDRPSQDFTAAGGQVGVSVSTDPGCAWTVSGGAPWVTVTAGGGTGSGTARYTVEPNIALSSRTATLTIAGRVHTVSQQGVICTFTLSPESQEFPASGGSGSISLSAALPVCPWSAVSNATWVTVGTPSGLGSGSVAFTVTPNPGTSSRSAVITVGGRSFPVQQNGTPPPCTYTIDPASRTVPAAAGSATVRVNTQGGCAWTASTTTPWITIPTASGTGTADITYTLDANAGSTSRSGAITVAGQQHLVTQQGAAPACTYAIDPATRSVVAGGATTSVRVSTQAGCTWTASSDMTWITVAPASATGTGTADVNYTVAPNTSTATRSGTVTVGGRQHLVTQQGLPVVTCTYTISPVERSFPSSGGLGTFTLTTGPTCNWTAVASAGWLNVLNATGTGSAIISYQVPSDGNRTGTITVGGQVHTVRQGNP